MTATGSNANKTTEKNQSGKLLFVCLLLHEPLSVSSLSHSSSLFVQFISLSTCCPLRKLQCRHCHLVNVLFNTRKQPYLNSKSSRFNSFKKFTCVFMFRSFTVKFKIEVDDVLSLTMMMAADMHRCCILGLIFAMPVVVILMLCIWLPSQDNIEVPQASHYSGPCVCSSSTNDQNHNQLIISKVTIVQLSQYSTSSIERLRFREAET